MEPFLAVVLLGEGGFAVALQFLLINPFFVLRTWLQSPQPPSKAPHIPPCSAEDPFHIDESCTQSLFPRQMHLLGVHPMPGCWCGYNPPQTAKPALLSAYFHRFGFIPSLLNCSWQRC